MPNPNVNAIMSNLNDNAIMSNLNDNVTSNDDSIMNNENVITNPNINDIINNVNVIIDVNFVNIIDDDIIPPTGVIYDCIVATTTHEVTEYVIHIRSLVGEERENYIMDFVYDIVNYIINGEFFRHSDAGINTNEVRVIECISEIVRRTIDNMI